MNDELAAGPLPSPEQLVELIAEALGGRALARDFIDELYRTVRRERVGGRRRDGR
jgi:hypothetical protein